MQCPPGLILNPATLKCVHVTGRVGRKLYEHGYVNPAEIQYAIAAVPYGYQTRKYQRTKPVLNRPNRTHKSCGPGYERNPITGRCIKIGGEIFNQLHGVPTKAPSVLGNVYERLARPVREPVSIYEKAPTKVPIALSPFATNSTTVPLGASGIAPAADKETILAWTGKNCKYTNDPLTGAIFADESQQSLQNLVRLHDGSCMAAPALNTRITEQHKVGAIATLPTDPKTHLTLGDFKALREAMRRTVPGYKIPGRTHQATPAEWQLYAASDQRSGPEFVSVLYVDITKARSTAAGVEYPLESIRIDLGFLPITPELQNLLAVLQKLAAMNRLLTPVAGGWKPAIGFPYSKAYWSTDRPNKIRKLYQIMLTGLAPVN